MGKDREGRFHPRKGKPSGSPKSDSQGLKPISSGDYEEHLEIADKYTEGEEEPAANLRVMHPNRNVDKKEERQQERSDAKNTKAKRQTFQQDADIKPALEIQWPVNREKFLELANLESDYCISAYLVTHPSGVEVNEQVDNTSFKNLLQRIEAELRMKQTDPLMIEKLLKPGYDLLRDDQVWRSLHAGLAVFITAESFQYLKLPMEPKEEVMINSSTLYLTPLLSLVSGNDYFYLLVLSKKRAKFFRADAFGMVELVINELPNGVDDVVHFEEKDDQKLFRTDTNGAGGGANFHGMGAGKPDEKEHIAIYFDEVDETLWKAVLNKENAPLLLAGVEYLIPLYKGVAQYKPIWDDHIGGSVEHEDLVKLYSLAKEKMAPFFDARHKKALDLYGNSSGQGLTSTDARQVVAAAHYKRVWHLFVAEGEHLWGSFDEMNDQMIVHDNQQQGDSDLIEKAVMKTLLSGGEVHVLARDRMPNKAVVAALMRY